MVSGGDARVVEDIARPASHRDRVRTGSQRMHPVQGRRVCRRRFDCRRDWFAVGDMAPAGPMTKAAFTASVFCGSIVVPRERPATPA